MKGDRVRLTVRMSSGLHDHMKLMAKRSGKSVNNEIVRACQSTFFIEEEKLNN